MPRFDIPRRPLGTTGLACHPFGFGGYRVADGNSNHEAALADYLARGGNLIDTSANYGDGASEELIGRVLGSRPRDEVIVVSKGGYIQGRNLQLAERRNFPEVVEYGVGIQHSIHPEFLATQIELSLERLQTDRVDVYLLHNPEYFLEDAARRRPLTAADHNEFYRRIGEAFRYLESQVAAGRIVSYGVSSNNFVEPPAKSTQAPTTATSIARCLQAARDVSLDHHFRLVQLPLNLYEAGAVLTANNDGEPALDYCRKHGLAVLANRPLNAFEGNRLVRLADPKGPRPADGSLVSAAEPETPLQELRSLEREFEDWSGEPVALPSGEAISDRFERLSSQLESAAQWAQVAERVAVTPIQNWLTEASARLKEAPELASWRERFVAAVNSLLASIGEGLEQRRWTEVEAIRRRLAAAGCPDRCLDEPLSRAALRILASLEGLSCTLVGMRRPEYVADVLATLDGEPVDGRRILAGFARSPPLTPLE